MPKIILNVKIISPDKSTTIGKRREINISSPNNDPTTFEMDGVKSLVDRDGEFYVNWKILVDLSKEIEIKVKIEENG